MFYTYDQTTSFAIIIFNIILKASTYFVSFSVTDPETCFFFNENFCSARVTCYIFTCSGECDGSVCVEDDEE